MNIRLPKKVRMLSNEAKVTSTDGGILNRIILILLIGTASFCINSKAQAQNSHSSHYRIKSDRWNTAPALQSPAELVYQVLEDHIQSLQDIFRLWEFDRVQGRPDEGAQPYNRNQHFGTWRRSQNSCLNTRAEVLIRDSRIPVKMRGSGCTVGSGLWTDPYGGRDYREASDVEIDHFVPLKNTYTHGAHAWNSRKRCVYTNFMGDREHLLPVYGRENGKKSDRGPEGYLPPQRAYHCRYITNWLRIKFTWGLALSSSEKEAIEATIRRENCSLESLQVTASQVSSLRRNIADKEKDCQ